MKISRERAERQVQRTALKNVKLETGTVVTVTRIETSETKAGKPFDILRCKTDKGKNLNITLREYFKFNCEDDLLRGDDDNIEIADVFKISESTDRVDKKGNTIYPTFAYKAEAVKRFLDKDDKFDWYDLCEAGLKEDNTYDPVQDYTIEIV